MFGRWNRTLRPLALGALGLTSLTSSTVEAAGPRAPVRTQPAVAPRAPARAPVHRAPARAPQPAKGATETNHKLRNRDKASFAPAVANSAWETLGFKKRFLKVGDAWTMAWSSRKRFSILKRAISPQERQTPKWAPPVTIHYRVSKVVTQDLAGHKRQVATITAVYGDRVRGRMQTGNELKVDQYLNPVERCVYTKWTPFGTCRDRDTRSVIRSMGAVPFFVGDLEHIQARPGRPLPVAPVFQKLLGRVNSRKSFAYVPVHSGRRKYADTYWAAGDLAPTYVLGENVQGVLIGQRIAR